MSSTPPPRLIVSTAAVADPGTLFPYADRENPLLWVRHGEGLAGFGEALRLEFSGPERLSEAARAWREVAAAAVVEDRVGLPGTGLVAMGAFAFSALSDRASALVIPEVIVGRAGGRAWVTRIRLDGVGEAPEPGVLPAREGLGRSVSVELGEGGYASAEHLAVVRAALERIRAGEVAKVVLARTLSGALPAGADRRRVAADLAASYPDCWTYAVGGMIGSSPETLISVRGGELSLRVLAGTAARGIDAEADARAATALLTSAKDREEHDFAVSSALASLEPHSAELLGARSPFTLQLPNLWHLATDIRGRITHDASALDLLEALHPTAAVGGTPTPAAVALIDALEPFDRGYYAGPVGWVDAGGNGEWAIALRGAQFDADGSVTAYAGGGIVAESDPDSELAETVIKFRPITDALS